MERKKETDAGRRRFFAILASPSLALHYTHTTPALELSYLRRIGLDKHEADELLALLCERGCMDEGARALLETGGDPAENARRLLAGRGAVRED